MVSVRTLALLALVLWGSTVPTSVAVAEEALTVSVTPPLFQITIGPGEFWASTVKVVNANPYDVTYYATVVNFEPTGEGGTGTFIPVVEDFGAPEKNTHSLAHWIEISKEEFTVPKGQSIDVPFSVRIPPDAEPGGHYAAILVGTQPPAFEPEGGAAVSVSSYVSSLFFARIKGEVIEDGRIREFTVEKSWYERPEANFTLRFENTGTVHVRPQGDITIYNMWGKERGKVVINQKTTFGNVLPGSTRRFQFDWASDASLFDIGRYRAEVALTFGDEVKRNVTATTYFYILPVVPLASTVAGVVVFFGGLFYFVRRYVRRVLLLEQQRLRTSDRGSVSPLPESPAVPLTAFVEPLREGVIDLRRATGVAPVKMATGVVNHDERAATQQSRISWGDFFKKYQLFFAFLALLGIGISLAVVFVGDSFVPSRTYEITNVSIEEEGL